MADSLAVLILDFGLQKRTINHAMALALRILQVEIVDDQKPIALTTVVDQQLKGLNMEAESFRQMAHLLKKEQEHYGTKKSN